MKCPPVELHRPRELDEVLALLADLGDDAKVLAGGQSLVPLLNFRLARPTHLVDINRVAGLEELSVSATALSLGALARQRAVERHPAAAVACPLLADALPFVGHSQIRNRGTVVGSVTHADPAAEVPAVALALDARVHCHSSRGRRELAAEDFFEGVFTTALFPDELVVRVVFPIRTGARGSAFEELSRRRGDFALVGVAASVALSDEDRVAEVRLVCSGVGATPVRCRSAEAAMAGAPLRTLPEAARLVTKEVDPPDDLHAPAEYRRHLAGVLALRALRRASDRALVALRA